MLRVFTLLSICHTIRAVYLISVYGDVFKDREFFTTTFPWIVDNIGGELDVEYQLLGSGRYSVPQMCALKELRRNVFLQAQYLKCEAEGRPSKYCLCETGIDPTDFTECVQNQGYLASQAAAEFMRLNVGVSPLIELGFGSGSTVFGVPDMFYLKKICTIFGEYKPFGCVKTCNNTESWVDKKAIAQFDKDCGSDYIMHNPTTMNTAVFTTPSTNILSSRGIDS